MVGVYSLRILHIGDMAGSGAITSNICNKLGFPSHVVQDSNIDTFRHGDYYENTTYLNTREAVYEWVKTNQNDYDYFVYHDQIELAERLDDLHKPSAYMFHGNILRKTRIQYDIVCSLESIDDIFVSTEDLLEYAPEAKLFYRPVDMDLFCRDEDHPQKMIGLCLTQERYRKEIKELLRDTDTGVLIADRVKNRIPYGNMPKLLRSYAFYYDVKYIPTHPPEIIEELSQTALQALACGCAVWSCGKWYDKFPREHDDEESAKQFINDITE